MAGLSRASSLILHAHPAATGDQSFNFQIPSICKTHEYDAFDSSRGKDPCQVATALWSNNACYGSSAPSLGLAQLQNNWCLCNTVYYSLLYVCGLCTSASILTHSWPDYSGSKGLHCSPSDVTTFSHPANPDVVIPAWASQPLGSDGKVNLAAATQSASIPAVTGAGPGSQTTPVPIPASPSSRTPEGSIPSFPMVSPTLTAVPNVQTAVASTTVPNFQTAVATSSHRTTLLNRPAYIGASAGLSAAAFVAVIAAVLLFRRDRRLTNAIKRAHLARSDGIANARVEYNHPPSSGRRLPSEVSVTNTACCGASDEVLGSQGPLRPQRLDPITRTVHLQNARRPTPGTFDGEVWRT